MPWIYKNQLLPDVRKKIGGVMNLAEAKEKFYPEYKYALVNVKSNKPHKMVVYHTETGEREIKKLPKRDQSSGITFM